MKMKENALKRRNEHLIYFLFSVRLLYMWSLFKKENNLHDMLSTPPEKTYPPPK